MKKNISLILIAIITVSCLLTLSGCSSDPYIYSDDEDFQRYYGEWQIVKYELATVGEINAEDIKNYALAFDHGEIIDYISMGKIQFTDTTKFADTTKYILNAWIYYLDGHYDPVVIESIDNGIRLGKVDFLWENDLLVAGNDEFKMYLQKVESNKN